MAKTWKTNNTKCWWGGRATESLITAGDTKEYSHFGSWSGSFLQSEIYSDYTIQQSYSLLFTQMILKLLYSYKNLQEYLQQLYP